MDIILWLRKLGILRFGSKSYTYTSGKDMPAEALMDDVYDTKKDLFFDKKSSSETKEKS